MYVQRAYCNLNQHLDVFLSHCLGRKRVCKNWCGGIEHCYTQAEVSRLQSRFVTLFLSVWVTACRIQNQQHGLCRGWAPWPSQPLQKAVMWSCLGFTARLQIQFHLPWASLCSLPAPWQVPTSLMLSRETPGHARDPEHSPGTASFWHSVIQ